MYIIMCVNCHEEFLTLVNIECHLLSPVHVCKIVKLAAYQEGWSCLAIKIYRTVQGCFMV